MTKKHLIQMDALKLNRICCVCQALLDGSPFDPSLKTSHGYCETCLAEFFRTVEQPLDKQNMS